MTAIEPDKDIAAPAARIAVIVEVIVHAYGDDAVLVAQRQLDAADDASRADWAAILQRIRRR